MNVSSTQFNPKSEIQYNPESIASKVIFENPNGNVTLFALDAGQQLSDHTAPYDVFLQVLDGSADIILSGELYSCKEHDTLFMKANAVHSVSAREPFKMMLTMIKSQ